MPIPRQERATLRKPRSWPWLFIADLGIACFAGVIGTATAIRFWDEGRFHVAALIAIATVGVLSLQIVKAIVQYRDKRRATSVHDLVGCLHTLKGALEPSADGARAGLRVTVYVPVENEQLEQVCDYACSDQIRSRKTATRRVPANIGVIGRAYQTGGYAVATRKADDPDVYIQDLITNWGFPADRARRVDPTVRSWMAVPLKTPERGVEAIVYVDAQTQDFFTQSRQELVLGACSGIALFVRQRYN